MANQSQLDILIKAMFDGSGVAQATQAFEGLRSTINTALGALGVGIGLQQLNELGNKALEVKEQLAAFTLQTLRSKDGSAELVKTLSEFNEELEKTTGTTQPTLRAIEQLFERAGASGDQIQKLTKGVIEYAASSAGTIQPLELAAAVAKRLGGAADETNVSFARFGLRARDITGIITEMNTRGGTTAETMHQASGGMADFEISAEHLRLAIGNLVNEFRIPFITSFIGDLDKATKATKDFTKTQSDVQAWAKFFGGALHEIIADLAAGVKALEDFSQKYKAFFTSWAFPLGKLIAGGIDASQTQQQLDNLKQQTAETEKQIANARTVGEKADARLNLDQQYLSVEKALNDERAKGSKADQGAISELTGQLNVVKNLRQNFDQMAGTAKSLQGTGVSPAGAGKEKSDTDLLTAAKLRLANAEGDYRLALEKVKALEESGTIEVTQGDALKRNAAQQYLAVLEKIRTELQRLQSAQVPGSKEWEQLQRDLIQVEIQSTKTKQALSDATFFGKMRSQIVQLKNEWSDLGKQLGGFIVQQAQAFASTMGNAIGSLIFRTGNLKQSILQLGQAFVSQLATMVIQYVLSQTILKGLAAAFSTETSATAAAAAKPVGVAWAGPAINASIATFGAAADLGLAQYALAFAAALGISKASGFLGGARSGGYAGDGGEDEPAGIYHGQEFIFSAPRVRALGRGFLEALHRGMSLTRPSYGAGGGSSGIPGGGGNAVHVYNFTDLREMTRHMASRKGRKIINDVMRGRNFDL